MLLRRITQHIKDQNWFAIFIDFIIVVVGVFIGIQVANWNEEITNREIAQSYIERLKEDLLAEKASYQNAINYYSSTRSHVLLALKDFKKPVDKLDKNFLIHLYQASQSYNMSLRRGVYDELLATGRIGFINSKTRTVINNFYEVGNSRSITFQKNSDHPYRRLIRMHMDETVQIEIRKHCDDVYKIDEVSSHYIELPEKCNISLPQKLIKNENLKLLSNKELQHELRFSLTSIDALLGSLTSGISHIDTTLKTISEIK